MNIPTFINIPTCAATSTNAPTNQPMIEVDNEEWGNSSIETFAWPVPSPPLLERWSSEGSAKDRIFLPKLPRRSSESAVLLRMIEESRICCRRKSESSVAPPKMRLRSLEEGSKRRSRRISPPRLPQRSADPLVPTENQEL